MQSNNNFIEQEDTRGRRFYFIRDGVKVAYLWFKWALNGWRLAFYEEKQGEDWGKRGPIESIEKLKSTLSI